MRTVKVKSIFLCFFEERVVVVVRRFERDFFYLFIVVDGYMDWGFFYKLVIGWGGVGEKAGLEGCIREFLFEWGRRFFNNKIIVGGADEGGGGDSEEFGEAGFCFRRGFNDLVFILSLTVVVGDLVERLGGLIYIVRILVSGGG